DPRDAAVTRSTLDRIRRGDDRDHGDADEHEHPERHPEERANRPELQKLGADETAHNDVPPPVSSRNASSSDGASATSSWRTIPFAAAISPTRGAGASVERRSPSTTASIPPPPRSSPN